MKEKEAEPTRNLTQEQFIALDFFELMAYIAATIDALVPENEDLTKARIAERAHELQQYFTAVIYPKQPE